MNDRVVASMHSSGVQLELTALAWRRTSLSVLANVVLPWSTKFFDQSGPSHSISSSLAFAGAVVAQCAGRGGRDLATAKSHVRQRHTTRLPRGQVTQEWR